MFNETQHISEYLKIGEYKDLFLEEKGDNLLYNKYIEDANKVSVDYIFLNKDELTDKNKPYIYVYDKRDQDYDIELLKTINKQVWTQGIVSISIIIYNDEIKVIDTRKPLEEGLPQILKKYSQIDEILRKDIFEGGNNNYQKDYSPYSVLIDHIKENILTKKNQENEDLRQVIIKCILIKFLEEHKDNEGKNVLNILGYEQPFYEILNEGKSKVERLFKDLSEKFNGGIFDLEKNLDNIDFTPLSNAFKGNMESKGQMTIWDLYDFNIIPVEFISVLYETFVVTEDKEGQKEMGAYYTPPHLASLMVDELLPLDKEFIQNINFNNFKILDPSCGSGVFLVLAFKRLVTYWKIKEEKDTLEEADINSIKKILSNCIYGNDINKNSLSITATSLQIELLTYLTPKQIFKSIKFDNLLEKGLTNWNYITDYNQLRKEEYDIITGNPPFGKIKAKVERKKKIPDNNTAYIFIYNLLNTNLKQDGNLFLVMPSSFIYGVNTREFKKEIFSNYNIEKIYDFTPLRDNLWKGKSKGASVSTISIKIKKQSYPENQRFIKHIVVRNTFIDKNEKRFIIDKYDSFNVLIKEAINHPYIWKINLLGGAFFKKFVDKLNYNVKIDDYLENNGFQYQDGIKSDNKGNKKVHLDNGKNILDSNNTKEDIKSDYKFIDSNNKSYRLDNENMYKPPFICIKYNINQNIPIVENYTEEEFYYQDSFLGIKVNKVSENELKLFADIFKKNRNLYIPYISIISSKSFIQRSGKSLINGEDIKRLPINLDNNEKPIEFEQDWIDDICIKDINIMANSVQSSKGKILKNTKKKELEEYSEVFCKSMNVIYGKEEYKFKPIRQIIKKDFIWVTFEHTNIDTQNILTEIQKDDSNIISKILKDDITNNGFRINRIITSYEENNRISFIKPINYKYWMQSIALRDAGDFKGELIKEYGI